ncbi:Protein N-acetyltransferase, RimJ/RimL family [Jannaschia faecimaris]|uniref:Protein N-acetyltransferase, RimJ/RimL family n=1 Tax=Jannaschia faecimaris TaxID=1244108 RepID=A0A1H3T1J0_9RHOB|nr:GNAT family N-acetyltransferase [Jannaschia faecimaris]SDZ43900.1 Protein N-acetyltransferase, RimJ/RimL family [Jannaschia faecimaris]
MTDGSFHIPTLATERLTLRAPRAEDVTPFAEFYASDAARYVGGPQAGWEAWRYLAGVVGHWAFRGFGRWIVTRKGDDAAIGLIGLHHPLDWPEPEIGWMLWANGQGYGIEAARAARDWAYGPGGMTTLISSIDGENKASIALAERMGARRDGAFQHPKFGELKIWRHPAPQEIAA